MSLPETTMVEHVDMRAGGPSMDFTGVDLPMLLAYLRQHGRLVTPDQQWLGGYHCLSADRSESCTLRQAIHLQIQIDTAALLQRLGL